MIDVAMLEKIAAEVALKRLAEDFRELIIYSGNQKAFNAGAPSKMSDAHKTEMYNDVLKGMGH